MFPKQVGNSEAGHLNIGAGRVVFQYLSRINKAIKNGEFFKNPAFLSAVNHVQTNNSSLHLIGLLTSSSVHAHFSHLTALIDLAKQNNINELFVHIFTDGRDCGLKEAPILVEKLEAHIAKSGIGKISTLVGRELAMDRNNNWDRVETTFKLLTAGEGIAVSDPKKALLEQYNLDKNDMTMPPIVVNKDGMIRDNDALILFDFREDRMRELLTAFIEKKFDKFERVLPNNLFVATMTQYLENRDNYTAAFLPPEAKNGLSEIISLHGKKQLHIAETEKYAHVTYFFNGLKNGEFEGENDVLITSDRDIASNPSMKAREITDEVVQAISKNFYDFILINFANPDMLAHLGKMDAVIEGIEIVDECVEKIKNAVLANNGALLVTADHGNAEGMTYASSGTAETKHSTNPVPLYLVTNEHGRERSDEEIEKTMKEPVGLLADIAPTVLELMEIEKPAEMTGSSLLNYLAAK